jgi:hypothetical protein
VLIEGNYFHDFAGAPGSGDHADMIQFWTTGTTSPSTNIIIRSNILDSSSGSVAQSIFMRNDVVDLGKAGLEMFYQNITIENNVIHNAQTHGITVGETIGLSINNNTILQNADSANNGSINVPRIHVNEASQDVVISNNILPRFDLATNAENWTVDNNLVVQRDNPEGDNYIGDLFANALVGAGSSLADFMSLPGSKIESLGVGSSLTRFNAHPDQPMGFILDANGSGMQSLNFAFDASSVYGSAGKLDVSGADIVWDYGDGNVGSGVNANHNFEKAGIYDVVAVLGKDAVVARLQKALASLG